MNLLMLSSPTISCGSKSHKFIVYCVNYLSQINLTSYINCFLGFVLWVLQLVNLEISLCLPCPALILAGWASISLYRRHTVTFSKVCFCMHSVFLIHMTDSAILPVTEVMATGLWYPGLSLELRSGKICPQSILSL